MKRRWTYALVVQPLLAAVFALAIAFGAWIVIAASDTAGRIAGCALIAAAFYVGMIERRLHRRFESEASPRNAKVIPHDAVIERRMRGVRRRTQEPHRRTRGS